MGGGGNIHHRYGRPLSVVRRLPSAATTQFSHLLSPYHCRICSISAVEWLNFIVATCRHHHLDFIVTSLFAPPPHHRLLPPPLKDASATAIKHPRLPPPSKSIFIFYRPLTVVHRHVRQTSITLPQLAITVFIEHCLPTPPP